MGTVLLVVAQRLPDVTSGKAIAIILAPSAGVLIGALARWGVRELDAALIHHRIELRHQDALRYQQAILDDRTATQRRKKEARTELDRLHKQHSLYLRRRTQGAALITLSDYLPGEDQEAD